MRACCGDLFLVVRDAERRDVEPFFAPKPLRPPHQVVDVGLPPHPARRRRLHPRRHAPFQLERRKRQRTIESARAVARSPSRRASSGLRSRCRPPVARRDTSRRSCVAPPPPDGRTRSPHTCLLGILGALSRAICLPAARRWPPGWLPTSRRSTMLRSTLKNEEQKNEEQLRTGRAARVRAQPAHAAAGRTRLHIESNKQGSRDLPACCVALAPAGCPLPKRTDVVSRNPSNVKE